MLAVSRQLPRRLLAPAASTQLESSRNKTVWIYRLAPEQPVTNRTMGPYPHTKEEREKAAKKYNLIPEDYETYPEDEGFGDYPKLPAIGAYNRYKYDDFDDPQDCRFYGEPFHLHADLYYWERIDPMEKEKITYKQYPMWKRAVFFFTGPTLLGLLFYNKDKIKINVNHPWKIREYNGNRPIYAFPPSPNDHAPHHH